ncbi:hypothetical protein JMK10_00225 [Rhodovulum sulfidophilum]|uniref:hypothetical protein n=1 Tax=Rhodovulum sulfidophilum TaxID=35806 RepID=UPI001924F8CE|nr:hypothetical protein [Rhodovulum sulfidophilum]MBL3575603.1 hypothetical protein [Rhodovulum sulfidophilum]MCE8431768.1 hypothetical protein [Rhodovulum sulfidophilum]MCF4115288.1 hypothetical protein [Rhodovulum sulfidophilum]
MKTPIGNLKDINLADHEICAQVLSEDKHQLIEGLVFESYFDQFLMSLSEASGEQVKLVDVDTAVVSLPRNRRGLAAFVWARSKGDGLGRYLIALNRRMPVWLVSFSDGEFFAAPFSNGEIQDVYRPLQVVAEEVSGRTEVLFDRIEAAVRDRKRINQSFWGYLSERHGDALGLNIVLPRIFLNWGIQPWFNHVWNVDRVFLHGDQLWHFEIKHKYPMERGQSLFFGINTGELRLMQNLVNCGLRSMHTLIVKPNWSKFAGSMYIQNDMRSRARAAVIGREMKSDAIDAALLSKGGVSSSDTTFTGTGSVTFRSFAANTFHRFGRLNDDYREVAGRIFQHMQTGDQPLCNDEDLFRLRINN